MKLMMKLKLHPLKVDPARRRGIGIELALLVLMVVFGLSALLVSTAMLEKNNLENEKASLTQRMELDRLGEEFCQSPSISWTPSDPDYTATVTKQQDTTRLKMTLSLDDKELLTVVLEASENAYKVVQWTYH